MIHFQIKYLVFLFILFLVLPLKAEENSQTRIAILYSDYTQKLNEDYIPKTDDQITLWEIFLMQNKIPYSVIYDRDLESGISEDFDILILPSVYSISEKELKSLKNFLEDGNSILNMGSKLNYDENQNFKNLDYLYKLFGIHFDEYNGRDLSLFQYLDQNPVLVNQHIKEPVMQISTKYHPLICKINSNYFNNIGYLKSADKTSSQTLLIYGKSGNGKFVNYGFNFDDVIGEVDKNEIIKSLILNSIKWLDKTPDVYIKIFPDDYTMATIVLLENSFGLKTELIDKLNVNGIEPYLVFTPEQKLDNAIISRFKAGHFILDLRSLVIDSSEINLNTLSFISDKEKQLKIKITAVLLSDQLRKNTTLISSLNVVGIKIFLFNQYFPPFPELTKNNNFFIPYYENDFGETAENMLNFITYKSKTDCENDIEKKFVDEVSKIKSYKNWFCTLDQLKEWYELKSNINISVSNVFDNNFAVTISNNNTDIINGINLLVNLPVKLSSELLDVKSGTDFIDYTYDGLSQLNLLINEINPQQLKKIYLSFNAK